MARLNKTHKLFIVQQLAFFQTPQEIVGLVKEEFGIEIKRGQVSNYDPTKPYYEGKKEWKIVFEDARKRYLENINDIPIANQAYRMQIYQDLISSERKKDERSRNKILMLQIAEQAAKDAGGMFTNQRRIEGSLTVTDNEVAELKQHIEDIAKKYGTDYQSELKYFLEKYAAKLKPDLKTKLASELIQ